MLNFTVTQIQEIERIIRNFLWKGKRDKIPIKILQLDHTHGGLRLVDLHKRQLAFKVKWIFKLEKNMFLREAVYSRLSPVLRDVIWQCNLNTFHVKLLFDVNNDFWAQVLQAWAEIHYQDPQTDSDVLNQIIWMNSNITMNNKPILWRRWFQTGILRIEDLWYPEGTRFLTREELSEKYGVYINWLDLESLKNAIPVLWRSFLNEGTVFHDLSDNLYAIMRTEKNITKEIYDILISDETKVLKYAKYWVQSCNFDFDAAEYRYFFKIIKCVTKETKLRDFQYRLNLNKIFTNVILKKWGITESDSCTFCQEEKETPLHLFVHCAYVKCIWDYIRELSQIKNILVDGWSDKELIFNTVHGSPEHVLNFIILFTKQYIYSCKCQGTKPGVQIWEKKLKYQHELELHNSKYTHGVDRHIRKWSAWYQVT